MKNILLIISLLLCSIMRAEAQNRIDAMVEKYSMAGNTRFISAIERDPATRKVKKVVRKLNFPYNNVKAFKEAFEKESATGNYTVTKNPNGTNSYLLINGKKPQTRIYMLEYKNYSEGNVTIIIKTGN